MEQTSASTGERREFLEAFLQYNRAFHAHHLSGTLKYSQDAYRTTVDIGTDVKNGIAKRHMGLAGRVSYNWNYRYLAIMVRKILLMDIVSAFSLRFLSLGI